jgi:hypothetical protein
MIVDQNGPERRFPQSGDIVLFGRATDGKGDVSEVPAIILGIEARDNTECRVDLKTFEIGHDMESHRDVRFSEAPKQGRWRWRPDR